MPHVNNYDKKHFRILVIIVAISGFSQGMLMPLISMIFERDGVSSTLNGLNATALYIGTLIVSPFMEWPLRRFGFKPVIIIGGSIVFSSLLLFPLWKHVLFWYILRLLIGIGDHALHFASQTWVTSISPQHRLGRNIAIYGLSFGVGFAVGPLLVPLVHIYEGLPFIVSGLLCMSAWFLVFLLKNDLPETGPSQMRQENTVRRFKRTIVISWLAFLGPFGYGFLESSLNAIYPVYALRVGLKETSISLLLVTFAVGGLTSQIPLGILSDKIGRRKVFLLTLGGGSIAFLFAALLEEQYSILLIMIFLAGTFVGSIFSLGISYMSDLAPRELLPTGNLLCGIFFSIGSLMGPTFGGLYLEGEANFSFLLFIACLLGILFILSVIAKPKLHQTS